MSLITFCAAVAITVMFITPALAGRYGDKVRDRFLEKGASHNAAMLREWIIDNPSAARGYAFPVIVPIDLTFMFALAGFAALGSAAVARELDLRVASWIWAVLPLVYLAADLLEAGLLVSMLTSADRVRPLLGITTVVTRIKIVTAFGSLGQIAVLSVWAVSHRPAL
jgi:hypothetical protein